MTGDTETSSFDCVSDVFVATGALSAPAELHGALTGQLCAGVTFSPKSWLRKAVEFMEPADELSKSQQDVVQQLHDATLAQLTDDDMAFQPLLPDDDTDLLTRLETLAQWCDGFLAGFALVFNQRHAEFSDIVSDALKDIAAIAQVGLENVEEGGLDDDAEADYMQVVEHLRLLVMNIYYENVALPRAPAATAAADVPATPAEPEQPAITSPASLFGKRNLH
jgi:yecA family protein